MQPESSRSRTIASRDAEARALMRSAGFEPVGGFPGRLEPWACRCLVCDTPLLIASADVEEGTAVCRNCEEDVRVDEEALALAVEARAEMMDAGLTPLTTFAGVKVPWPCQCHHCSLVSELTLHDVRRGGRCPHCVARSTRDAS